MSKPKVVFARFTPFNVACYDMATNVIAIDEKLKGTKVFGKILKHELEHSRSKKILDWSIESKRHLSLGDNFAILRLKPLWVFSPIIPIIAYKHGGKWNVGIEYLRVVTVLMLVCAILLWVGR